MRASPWVLRKRWQEAALIALCALLSFYVMGVMLTKGQINKNGAAKLEHMMEGTASRPYVYRVLVPKIILLVRHATPDSMREPINSLLQECDWSRWALQQFHLSPEWGYEGMWLLALLYLALVGYLWMLTKLASLLLPESPLYRNVALFLALLALPPFMGWGYLYDFPALFLWTGCFYALAAGKYAQYMLWLLLAMLNKETALVMVLFYALWNWDREGPALFRQRLGQQFIGLASLLFLMQWRYSGNPGFDMMPGLAPQKNYWLEGYGFPQLWGGLVLATMLIYGWQEKPLFLKRALWLFVPFFVLYLAGGYPPEFRVFYELHPIVVLMAAHSLVKMRVDG